MPYRFVHAADIHLDSPLRSLALRDADLAELIGTATRRAFIRVVDLCLAEKVDALLISGDLYDGDQKSMKTARLVAEQIGRLHLAGIRVFMIRGNHDAMSKIIQELTLPDSAKIFAGRAETVAIDAGTGGVSVAIHGISFAEPHAPESLLPKFRAPIEGAVNIGLLHTSLGGAPGHDAYAPCSEADLHGAGFRYWALGHIHKRSVATAPSTIVMPGMPQGRDINESGAKSVSLVTIGDDRSITVEERVTSIAQFERVAVDLGGVEDWRSAIDRIERGLGEARGQAGSEHLVVRLRLGGTTPLAWRLRRDAELLAADIGYRAAGVGRTWIDKLLIECAMPGLLAERELSADPLAELERLIGSDILRSDLFRAEAETLADDLVRQLPTECRDLLGSDPAEHAAALAELTREGVEDVLAHLRTEARAA